MRNPKVIFECKSHKISEIIKELSKVQDVHGDINLFGFSIYANERKYNDFAVCRGNLVISVNTFQQVGQCFNFRVYEEEHNPKIKAQEES